MVAMVIVLISAGIAIPKTTNTLADIKLRGSASDFAGLLQQARISAVQKNGTYIACFGLPSGQGSYAEKIDPTTPAVFCDGYSTGDLMIQFGGSVNQVSAPTTNPTTLNSTLGWTPTSGNVSFNSRGLPCSYSSPTCTAGVNYVFYFNDTRAFGGKGWAAVSVTSAGRTKVWFWSGTAWIS